MIDEAAVNEQLAGTGWTVAVTEDTSVGGSVIVTDEPVIDEKTGLQALDENGQPLTESVHSHVPLEAPAFVLLVTRNDEELRFSPGYDAGEVLLALWDYDSEKAIHAAHERGEHGEAETRVAGCQRCWEQVWARDAEQSRHDALYGGRSPELTAWVKERLGE